MPVRMKRKSTVSNQGKSGVATMQYHGPRQPQQATRYFVRSRMVIPTERRSIPGPSVPQPTQRPQRESGPQADEGLFIISVAARMLSMHPQTLRKYERVGLVKPSRTIGMLRLYSQEDITKLRMIKHLVEEVGLNLAGVELVIAMVERLLTLRQRMTPSPAPQIDALQQDLEEILRMLQFR
jgi:MerR family transcriptional regulator/heat shock protein HspR